MELRQIQITALIPTRAGCALFLGSEEKVIQFFIDLHIGSAINDGIVGNTTERPLTHDVFAQTLAALGAKASKVILTDYNEGIYYARIYWEMDNEVYQRKILEIDIRPSDAIAIAVRHDAPIYINEEVWQEVEDKSQLLIELKEQAEQPPFE